MKKAEELLELREKYLREKKEKQIAATKAWSEAWFREHEEHVTARLVFDGRAEYSISYEERYVEALCALFKEHGYRASYRSSDDEDAWEFIIEFPSVNKG